MQQIEYPPSIRFWYFVHDKAERFWHWVYRTKLEPWHHANAKPPISPKYYLIDELEPSETERRAGITSKRVYVSSRTSRL